VGGRAQVSMGSQVVKPNAVKVRRIGDRSVIVGFAGATADALTLMERLEGKLETHSNQLLRACVEMAKDWRTEKYLRRLEAIMLVVDKSVSLEVTGNGDVLEPYDGIIAIGSGGPFARAAARALLPTDLSAMEIAERAMEIAADMCVYTNRNFVKDELIASSDDLAPPAEAANLPLTPSVSAPARARDNDSDSDSDAPKDKRDSRRNRREDEGGERKEEPRRS
jgi:ATP-dependent HslUV protease, peptidase subunit HslV